MMVLEVTVDSVNELVSIERGVGHSVGVSLIEAEWSEV